MSTIEPVLVEVLAFQNAPENPDFLTYHKEFFNDGQTENLTDPYIDGPFDADFSYATGSNSYTAAGGGCPLGDLRWFEGDTSVDVEQCLADSFNFVAGEEGPNGGAFAVRTFGNPVRSTLALEVTLDGPGRDERPRSSTCSGARWRSRPGPSRPSARAGRSSTCPGLAPGVYVYRVDRAVGERRLGPVRPGHGRPLADPRCTGAPARRRPQPEPARRGSVPAGRRCFQRSPAAPRSTTVRLGRRSGAMSNPLLQPGRSRWLVLALAVAWGAAPQAQTTACTSLGADAAYRIQNRNSALFLQPDGDAVGAEVVQQPQDLNDPSQDVGVRGGRGRRPDRQRRHGVRSGPARRGWGRPGRRSSRRRPTPPPPASGGPSRTGRPATAGSATSRAGCTSGSRRPTPASARSSTRSPSGSTACSGP